MTVLTVSWSTGGYRTRPIAKAAPPQRLFLCRVHEREERGQLLRFGNESRF